MLNVKEERVAPVFTSYDILNVKIKRDDLVM